MRPISTRLTCEVSWKCHAQSDVEIFITRFFWKNGKKNWGIHRCIVFYPIRVVMICAIADNYWHFIYFIQTHILALKWFNMNSAFVSRPVSRRHHSRTWVNVTCCANTLMSVIGVDHIALVLLIVFLGFCRISSWGSVITFLSCCR